jgi:hypothetical protein
MSSNHVCLFTLMLVGFGSQPGFAAEAEFRYFDTKDTEAPGEAVPVIAPWKTIPLEADHAGLWLVAGELDGDGQPDMVTAKNFNQGDVHYTSSVAVQKLDGSTLWTWGDPKIGRKELHHDVACQIQDWDGDGRNEVIVATKGALVELDGRTGTERLRVPIKEDATDSITFCNFSGDALAETVLVKDRYHSIWAYTRDGKLLWSVKDPGGHQTAHQPRPMDIDGDGIDEIFAGYAMLNADGSVRWIVQSESVKKKSGHLDCARMMTLGGTPGETRIALTFCGGNNLAVIDGDGRVVWELSGRHFESIQVGRIIPGEPAPQLLVDIDHQPLGDSPLWVIGGNGQVLGQLVTNYSRQHRLIEWDGDDFDEFVVARDRGLYNHTGKRLATFGVPGVGTILHLGDMDGDGRNDVIFNTDDTIYIFRNERGKKPSAPIPLGTGTNVTLY